ncbi:unnamed protein product [Rhizoctonia solani]|uniref:Uncharacterized protein n=1 Tax=Rhizoctonia solani TaxID=456999 RepID=A0A8H3H2H6_9AGAM|nr:unnamed protein product [Rhizoctonia solani]
MYFQLQPPITMISLIDIWTFLKLSLFSLYRWIHPPIPIMVITRSRQPILLPQETLDYIFSLYVASLVHQLRYETMRDYRVRQKYFMRDLCRVARCSKLFHQVMTGCLRRTWASCSRKPSPPASGSDAGNTLTPSVWIITAEEGSLPLDFNLAPYKRLEIASINYHGSVEWSGSQQDFRRFRCIRAYPRSLRQLEILHSHTPEQEVVRLVSDCCPGLTELRLVRCTMFNDPECWYWRTHSSNRDHDYMQSYDLVTVVGYANRMAHLLSGLPWLEAIHIGHYLVSINAVFTHRMGEAHKRHHPITDKTGHGSETRVFNRLQFTAETKDDGPPVNWNAIRLADRELWAKPCPECEHQFRSPIEIAERLAAGILVAHSRSLKNVSFANFLSDRRIRPSCWVVGHEQRNTDLRVWTEDPSRPRSRILQEMVPVEDRWEPPRVIQ